MNTISLPVIVGTLLSLDAVLIDPLCPGDTGKTRTGLKVMGEVVTDGFGLTILSFGT